MPDTGYNRHDGTSSEEEESEEEVVITKKKSFGFRVAQSPQQAQQQVLSQIGNLSNQLQANEVVVDQQTPVKEKSEEEKKALEQREKMLEAQKLAQAQQAAAIQQAAAKVAAQGPPPQSPVKTQQEAALRAAQEQVKKAQEEALKRTQEAQAKAKEAQQEAIARAQEAQKRAQADAQAKALEAQRKAQEEAKSRAEAQKKAQADAQARALEAQKKAEQEAKSRADAQKKAQADAQARSLEAQKKAQAEAQAKALEAQKKSQATSQMKAQEAQKKLQEQAKTNSVPQQHGNAVSQRGTLSNEQPIQQEIHSATGPRWSRTPGKVQTQGPQPEQPKQAEAVAVPQGNTALRQTAQLQEQELAKEKSLTKSPMLARKPQIQADHLAERFVEKPEEPINKISVQKGQQLEGARRWVADSSARENPQDMQTEAGPKAVILQDDSCWQTQKRVPVEIQQPQIGRIQIPELGEKEIQRTIVAQPASYHKVQWNEFPEEQKIELGSVPKTKTQEWIPVNQEQIELQRSIYKPARISAVWPPVQDDAIKEGHTPLVVKANEDTAWIQQDQFGVTKQAVWGKTARINRVWPPPENEQLLSDFSGPQHMPVVQWPPPESEAHEREQVEVLQKHIPTKKIERQWPPPPPQYQVVESSGEIATHYNPAEISQQQQQQQSADQQANIQQHQMTRSVIRSN